MGASPDTTFSASTSAESSPSPTRRNSAEDQQLPTVTIVSHFSVVDLDDTVARLIDFEPVKRVPSTQALRKTRSRSSVKNRHSNVAALKAGRVGKFTPPSRTAPQPPNMPPTPPGGPVPMDAVAIPRPSTSSSSASKKRGLLSRSPRPASTEASRVSAEVAKTKKKTLMSKLKATFGVEKKDRRARV
jgi:hypothetical protein